MAEIVFKINDFDFLKRMSMDDTAVVMFVGEIIGERKEEENDEIFKMLSIRKMNANTKENVRV